MPVVLCPDASRDAEEARNYFETSSTGLGQVFLDRLNEVLVGISDMPELYGDVWQGVRAARLRKFTYVVYYRVHNDRVEVLAVMHGSRDSSTWQARK